MSVRDKMRDGMSREVAERLARLEIGGVDAAKDMVRDGGWEASIELLLRDLFYGLRALRRQPAFTAVVSITLALGIGANAAMFSVVDAILLRPLPFKDPDRLAMLWTADVRRGVLEEGTSYPTYSDWASQSHTFAEMAICSRGHVLTVLGGAEPELVKSEEISTNLFGVLGVAPVLGRAFTFDDAQRQDVVVVISHAYWQRRFGGSRTAIGAWLEIAGGHRAQIVGVMPRGFYFPSKDTHVWSLADRSGAEGKGRFNDSFRVIGRLRPGATFAQAQTEMTAIGERLKQAIPDTPPTFVGFGVNVVPMLEQFTGRNLTLALWVLLGAVGFVLAIACVNVANLQLARGAARLHEFGIRSALGATRTRLVRQLFAESLLLSGLAGVLGFGVAVAGVKLLGSLVPAGITRLDEIRIDARVFAFTVILALISGTLFGLIPALRLARTDANDALKRGGQSATDSRGTRRVRGLLVVVECAMAMTLLIGAGLFVRSLIRMQLRSPGFQSEGVALARLSIPLSARLGPTGVTQVPEIYQQIIDRVSSLPGVVGAGTISNFVLARNADLAITIRDVGIPARGLLTSEVASPGFFSALRVPIISGRGFTRAEALSQDRVPSLAIVNETFARRYFADMDPIGRQFKEGTADARSPWITIIGVAGDIRRRGLEKEVMAEIYYPGTMWWIGTADLVARTSGDPVTLAAAIKREVHAIEPTAVVTGVTTMNQQMRELTAQRRFQTWLLGLFAATALGLALVGIYGVLHFNVAQRTREIGVRIAFGATPARIVRMTIGEGLRLAFVGLLLGLVASIYLSRFVSTLLLDTRATDPLTFTGVAVLLFVAALVASFLPARRAARVDPMIAIRQE
jgi:putative ABC transport system permease protein